MIEYRYVIIVIQLLAMAQVVCQTARLLAGDSLQFFAAFRSQCCLDPESTHKKLNVAAIALSMSS